jgi:hypothetical protein
MPAESPSSAKSNQKKGTFCFFEPEKGDILLFRDIPLARKGDILLFLARRSQ